MPQTRRVAIVLPDKLVAKVDAIARREKESRSGLIREAVLKLVAEREQERRRLLVRLGYERMGALNVELAEEGFSAEDEDFARYEAFLAGDK